MGYSCGYMQFLLSDISHLPEIRELAKKIWNDHYPEIIGQEQVNYMLDKMYDLQSLKSQIEKGDMFYLVRDGDLFLGFASVSKESSGEWFLNKLYVDTIKQRSGIGRGLMDFIISENTINTLRLQVNRQNYQAINFYFKFGFVIESIADFDIGDGYFMNDFVMIWRRP